MRPDAVILVTGDADFAYLATKLRRHGIRVEVASVAANLGHILRSAANDVIDLAALFRTFEMINAREPGRAPTGRQPVRSPARAEDAGAAHVRMRQYTNRRTERANSPDAARGFARNKV